MMKFTNTIQKRILLFIQFSLLLLSKFFFLCKAHDIFNCFKIIYGQDFLLKKFKQYKRKSKPLLTEKLGACWEVWGRSKKRHSLWFNALGLQKHGVGTVIGFLSIAFENRLLKSLKRKSLQERIAQAVWVLTK